MKRNTCLFPGFFAIAAAIGCGSAPPTDQNFSIPATAPAECDQRQLTVVAANKAVTKIAFPTPNAGSYYVTVGGKAVRSPLTDGYYPGVSIPKDTCGKAAVELDTSGAAVFANPGQTVGACPKGGATAGMPCYNFSIAQGGAVTPYLAAPTPEQIRAEQAMTVEIAAEQAATQE